MKSDFKKFIEHLRKNKSFIVASHANPEGDAVSSTLAIAYILKRMKKSVYIYNADKFPCQFSYLPLFREVKQTLPKNKRFDMAIIVDCSKIALAGEKLVHFLESNVRITAKIDHHKTNDNFADVAIIDPLASATGDLIYSLIKKMGLKIDLPCANCIYTSISCDTGSFHFPNSNLRAFKIASEMVDLGVKPWEIAENVYEHEPVRKLKLLERALSTLDVTDGGRVASVFITKGMLDETGSTRGDTEGLINYPRSIDGVKIALMFREINNRKYKVSLRSKNEIDVSKIAEKFGGGGHKGAAAFIFESTFRNAKSAVLKEIKKALKLHG
ncbi:MAG TPA: bifunctional oligoribonuclease/PAP phosphatase NrnA [bacterium]